MHIEKKITLFQRFSSFYLILKQHHHREITKLQIFYILIFLPFFLYFDSPQFNQIFTYGQWINNYWIFWTYLWLYSFAHHRIKMLMTITIFTGFGAEVFASVICKLYTYRLDRIPIYVPFGHAIIFTMSIYIRQRLRKHTLEFWLHCFAFLLCLTSLFVLNDMIGTAMYVLFLLLMIRQKDKLIYLVSFFLCYYLEILGTQLHVWTWYSTKGTYPSFPHIANPPAGVGVAYLLLHQLSLRVYVVYRKWMSLSRLKLQRKLQING